MSKHLHDLRGTAATRFAGIFRDDVVAEILGWEPDQVRAIKTRYVDRDRIALGWVEQVEEAERVERGKKAG